jgi:polyhydroxyalkanoate synthesis regulator phasin
VNSKKTEDLKTLLDKAYTKHDELNEEIDELKEEITDMKRE